MYNIPDFTDINLLYKYIEESVHESLLPTADVVLNLVKKFIWENMYEAYSPDQNSYRRTYEFANCVSLKFIDNRTIQIFYDSKKIHANEAPDGSFWDQHMSQTSGQDMSMMLPIFIERGTSGSLWDREPLGAMEAILNNQENSHKLILRELVTFLNKQGIKAAIIG